MDWDGILWHSFGKFALLYFVDLIFHQVINFTFDDKFASQINFQLLVGCLDLKLVSDLLLDFQPFVGNRLSQLLTAQQLWVFFAISFDILEVTAISLAQIYSHRPDEISEIIFHYFVKWPIATHVPLTLQLEYRWLALDESIVRLSLLDLNDFIEFFVNLRP